MQIVVRQISGLGNQFFQYAAGRFYAKRYGATMRMALDLPENAHSYGSPRPFLLDSFSIAEPMSPLSHEDRLILTQSRTKQLLSKLVQKMQGVQIFTEPFAQRYTFSPDLPLHAGVRKLYLLGYWQTARMVDEVAQELRTALKFRTEPAGKNAALIQKIRTSEVPISVHIRRGDYTLSAEGNIALPFTYYERAIQHCKNTFYNPVFFIFSDDMDYARASMPSGVASVFVEHNSDAASQEDLRLMSTCRHHIIANSTFSWWGSWLNPDAGKLVIAPKFWHLNSSSYYPDLLPSTWTLFEP